ncbi:hypothetical protein FWF48_01435 [Candidatus Saccharibacteria bacterium]|nr:hypothetical protein [Candidatus Saccharibacteria bacterium]
MIVTLALAIIAGILYTLFDLFVAQATGKIGDGLSAFIYNGLGAVLPLIIYFVSKVKSGGKTTVAGIVYSILAGVIIAIFALILMRAFASNGGDNVAFVLPLIYGIVVVLSAVAGVFLFKEHLSLLGIIGVIVTAAGIGLVVFAKMKTA